MAEPRTDWRETERYETEDPRNPPNAVVNPAVRATALWAYLGPIVGLFVIVAIALLYWMTHDSRPDDQVPAADTIGTSGAVTPGRSDPAPRPNSTREEIERRGNLKK